MALLFKVTVFSIETKVASLETNDYFILIFESLLLIVSASKHGDLCNFCFSINKVTAI